MGKTILVVEDNSDNRRVIATVLVRAGYRVIEATDGLEALAQVRAEQPALILMDLSLPNLDGWDTTRVLKRYLQTRHLPVVAVTAHAMHRDEREARAVGCDDYLSKPFSPAALRAMVSKHIGGPVS